MDKNPYIIFIISSKDVPTILECPPVSKRFEVKYVDDEFYLNFLCCPVVSTGINLKDPNFTFTSTGKGNWQPDWFTNFKKSIIRHLLKSTHKKTQLNLIKLIPQKINSF